MVPSLSCGGYYGTELHRLFFFLIEQLAHSQHDDPAIHLAPYPSQQQLYSTALYFFGQPLHLARGTTQAQLRAHVASAGVQTLAPTKPVMALAPIPYS